MTPTSLKVKAALQYYLDKVEREYGPRQKVEAQLAGEDTIIRWLPERPDVEVDLRVMPADARHTAKIDVFNDAGQLVKRFTEVLEPHPMQDRFPAGQYSHLSQARPAHATFL